MKKILGFAFFAINILCIMLLAGGIGMSICILITALVTLPPAFIAALVITAICTVIGGLGLRFIPWGL